MKSNNISTGKREEWNTDMETSVQLQQPFSYSTLPLVILGGVLALCVIYIVACVVIKKLQEKPKKNSILKSMPVVKDLNSVKQKYLVKLDKLELDLKSGNVVTRTAFQSLSVYIREFVNEVTGINVVNCTLADIHAMNIPVLEELVGEYYLPAFARESVGDGLASINKTKRAIERWN